MYFISEPIKERNLSKQPSAIHVVPRY